MLRFSIIKGFALADGDDVARHATVIRRKRRLVNISFIIADRERKGDLMDMMMTDLMTNANAAGATERSNIKLRIHRSLLLQGGYRATLTVQLMAILARLKQKESSSSNCISKSPEYPIHPVVVEHCHFDMI